MIMCPGLIFIVQGVFFDSSKEEHSLVSFNILDKKKISDDVCLVVCFVVISFSSVIIRSLFCGENDVVNSKISRLVVSSQSRNQLVV